MADMDAEEVRSVALSLPETLEQPHFDSASFRVRGHIFATLPADGERAHIFVGEEEVHAAVAERPESCEELWWGKRLSGVRVRLPDADPVLVAELIIEAWRRKAPKRLVATLDHTEVSVRGPRRRPSPGR
jgi:hypothetical protein